MSTITKGLKVVLMREYGDLKKLGMVYEVGNITESHIIIRNVKNKVAVAAIDVTHFDKYFEIRKAKTKFTDWVAITEPIYGNIIAKYKTNGYKTIVKIDNYKASSSCYKEDEFSLMLGINIAYWRCMKKVYTAKLEALENELKELRLYKNLTENNIKAALKKSIERSKKN